jgi:hypothetical protein
VREVWKPQLPKAGQRATAPYTCKDSQNPSPVHAKPLLPAGGTESRNARTPTPKSAPPRASSPKNPAKSQAHTSREIRDLTTQNL